MNMELVTIVIALALIEYSVFGMLVGRARGKYGVEAPAVSGDPIFERYYRVQQNTLEVLVLFIPGVWMFAHYVSADVAAGLGLIFIIGRLLYLRGYVADPKSRSLGFALSFIPALILIIGGLIGAAMHIV
jgi:glutathione S-transferase